MTASAFQTRPKRTARYAVLAVLIALGGSLGMGELMARMFLKDQIVLFPRYHAAADYGEYRLRRLRPNTEFWHTSRDGSWKFVINARGFRDAREIDYQKPAGILRILVLGDSNTEGFEVRQDQTYAAILERYLARRGVQAEVMNTGVSGFGTAEELIFLEQEGLKYHPDVVVLGFFANDFEDNLRTGLFQVADGKLSVQKKDYTPGVALLSVLNSVPLLRWLSENSYLYSGSLNAVWELAKGVTLSRAQASVGTETAVGSAIHADYPQTLTLQLLQRLHRACRDRGIPLVLLDIPWVAEDRFGPSVPPDLRALFEAASDYYINGTALLQDYAGLAELHVRHGQRHISEFSHLILGSEIGRRLLASVDLGAVMARHAEARLSDRSALLSPGAGTPP